MTRNRKGAVFTDSGVLYGSTHGSKAARARIRRNSLSPGMEMLHDGIVRTVWKAAMGAKAGCPTSRLCAIRIAMDAKLESFEAGT